MKHKKLQKRKLKSSSSEKSLVVEDVIYAELFEQWSKLKTQQRATSIVEAAIECYQKYGIENATYERVAEQAGISRPLIFKYFRDHEDLFYYAVKLIRVHFQHFAVAAMQPKTTPKEKLSAYIYSTFQWLEKHPSYAGVLLLYLHRCTSHPRDKDLNTQFSMMGATRIAALIRMGVEVGEFKTSSPDIQAKSIQVIIAGAMLTQSSEKLLDPTRYQTEIHDLCMNLVGAIESLAG